MQRFKNQMRLYFSDDKFCEKALEFSHEKLEGIIIAKRHEELHQTGTDLKASLLMKGRCPKCTLKIPCKHFKDLSSVNLIHPMSFSPNENEKLDSQYNNLKQLYKNPEKTRKKLVIQENIQKFKEQKLENELAKLQAAENQINLEQLRQKSQDIKRRRYFDIQKEKIKKHKEDKQSSGQNFPITSFKSSKIKSSSRVPVKFHHKMEEIKYILHSYSPYPFN